MRARALPNRGSQEAPASHGRSRSVSLAKVTALAVLRLILPARLASGTRLVLDTTLVRASPIRARPVQPLKVLRREARRQTTHAQRAQVGRSTRSLMRSRAFLGRPRPVWQVKVTRPVQSLLMRLALHAAQANFLQRMTRRPVRIIRLPRALPGP